MPLPSSHVVDVMARVRDTMLADLAGPVPNLQVEIANPAQVTQVTRPLVTVFVYRMERSGTALAANAGLPAALIMHILLTAYAPPQDDGGDNEPVGLRELKLLALVGRVFGAERDLGVVPVADTAPLGLIAEIAPQSLSARIHLDSLENEDLNHIWTTQAQTPYRASLPYRVEFGLLTPFAPILAGPPVLAVREDIEDRAAGIPAPGDPSRGVPAAPSAAAGALVVFTAGGAVTSEVTLPPPQPGPGLDVSLLASSRDPLTLDLTLSVLRRGAVAWTTAADGRLTPASLPTVPAGALGDSPSDDATVVTITTEADDAAYRIEARPQGQALPVFAPVVVLLEGVPLGPEDGG